MSAPSWFVELEATTDHEITEEIVDQITTELAGTAPVVANTAHTFRVHLAVEASSNGFFTGLESAATRAIALVSTAAGATGITPMTFTELKVTAE